MRLGLLRASCLGVAEQLASASGRPCATVRRKERGHPPRPRPKPYAADSSRTLVPGDGCAGMIAKEKVLTIASHRSTTARALMTRRGAGAVASTLLLVSLASCTSGSKSGAGPSASPTSTESAAASSTSTAVATEVPEIECSTVMGVPAPAAQPKPSTRLDVPGAQRLAVYTDSGGRIRLVAPRGWSCTATDAADGGAQVIVTPAGETVPTTVGSGWKLDASSTVQAVAAEETSACSGCTLGQACPLFEGAASAFQSTFGRPCPAVRPGDETVKVIHPGIILFEDPPGTAGDGLPSGGRYPANGVMTYHPGNPDGSWLATCTLPASEHQLCTSSLNNFLASYGND